MIALLTLSASEKCYCPDIFSLPTSETLGLQSQLHLLDLVASSVCFRQIKFPLSGKNFISFYT